MPLIVVESPTKARTFTRILKMQGKDDYKVFATVGHFRDLPGSEMAVDYTNHFEPKYAISEGKEKVVKELTKLAKEYKEVILATDEDREGESISYHITYVLGMVKEKWPDFKIVSAYPLKRIVFHEITPKALEEALANPGELRMDLVKAQQARRILDRVVGYELSPLLWKKLGKNWLSAGRVQTVGLRLVVEREKERRAFAIVPYFQIDGNFEAGGVEVKARLKSKDDVAYEQKIKLQLFAGDYEYTRTTIDEKKKDEIKADLEAKGSPYNITEVTDSTVERYPPPPYTTSLLQIDSYQKHGFPSKLTMRLAQTLYEQGLISYHRTDSFNLSANYVFRAKDYIAEAYGKEYALEKPRGYRTKSKGAQEAHEAIRPTHADRSPHEVTKTHKLNSEALKLYTLIFNRALATQMAAAKVKTSKVSIKSAQNYVFEAEHQQVVFDGFLKVANPAFVESHSTAFEVKENAKIELKSLEEVALETKPPYRYNDATLVKTLEEKEIGRPSTYASIISNILDKNYIARESRFFAPTMLGEVISDYLSASFPQIFELNFTAKMEEELDAIAEGSQTTVGLLDGFFDPFKKELDLKKKDAETSGVLNTDQVVEGEMCETCGKVLVYRYGKFGKFKGCIDYPKCKFIKKDLKFVEGKTCPKCGKGRVVARFSFRTRKRFYGCEHYPKCDFTAFALASLEPEVYKKEQEAKAKAALNPKKPAKTKAKAVKKKIATKAKKATSAAKKTTKKTAASKTKKAAAKTK